MPGSRFSGSVGRGHRAGKLDSGNGEGPRGIAGGLTTVSGYLGAMLSALAGKGLGRGWAQVPSDPHRFKWGLLKEGLPLSQDARCSTSHQGLQLQPTIATATVGTPA